MALRFSCSNRREDQVILRVSPRALDRAFAATDPQFYASVSIAKVARLLELPADERIPAPIIGAYDGRIGFENGRHRARAAMLQGLKVIPVIVYRDNAAAVRELLARFRKARRAEVAEFERDAISKRTKEAADDGSSGRRFHLATREPKTNLSERIGSPLVRVAAAGYRIASPCGPARAFSILAAAEHQYRAKRNRGCPPLRLK
jgi:hypothetical protein